jgi:hypothetical protein
MKARYLILLSYLLIVYFTSPSSLRAQGTAFTYQGRLNDAGAPANGAYDLVYTLYSTNANGTAAAGPITNSATPVTNGLFINTIDFGGVFTGSNYWLDIAVRTNGSLTFIELTPRQPLTPAPYAVFANTANNLNGTLGNTNLPGSPNFSGTVTAGSFAGNGGTITNLNTANFTGVITNAVSNSFLASSNYFYYLESRLAGSEAVFMNFQSNSNCINLSVPNDAYGGYASMRFTWGNGPPPTSFQEVAAIGISTQVSPNFSQPWPNQSNYGIYVPGTFYVELDGGKPWVFAGTGVTGTGVPEMFMEYNHYGIHITDWQSGSTNYFNFNRTNASFSVPYGTVSALALADGTGKLPAAADIASLSGTNIFTGSNAFTGSVYTASNYAVATFVGTVTVTNVPTFNHTNTAPANPATPVLWLDVTNNGSVYKIPLYR